ncbi:hypothetical protein CXB51_025596 [Gossypium anomalum]|uniref:Reverse transcriptase Ty1/copia-type domain-containing protein n=1 Tax=Gossypium anomalum TaxID=47600 RepID=A0A8J5YAJ5_9ROSI|nr:hypothetical protein CXB51_025596 [Gossypium anomalum]
MDMVMKVKLFECYEYIQIKMQAVLTQMDLEDALLGIDKMPSTLIDEEKKRCDEREDRRCIMKDVRTNMYVENSNKQVVYEVASLCLSFGGRDTILYSRESITVDEVYDSLTSYDKMKHLVVKPDSQGESLIARGDKIEMLIMIMEGYKNGILAVNIRVDRKNYSDGELLVASVNDSKVSEEWILDSGCTFHMSPSRDWFTTYEIVPEGVVLMGNNASCKLKGSTVSGDAAVASSSLSNDDITKLWHMRLGHMSENGMIVQVRRDYETLDSSSYSTAKRHCRTNEQNDHAEGSISPSVAIEKKTPQDVWSGNPTNYSDLKIFGCPTYAHVDNGKLEPRSIKCVFLGYKASKYVEADLVAYALKVAEDIDANREPSNYSEAISCEDSEKWMFAMQEEMESLQKQKMGSCKLPKGKKVVHCKWVFKKKEGTLGVEEPRYKARLAANELEQLDVKTVFLHGELEEDIYMQQRRSPRQWYKRFDSFMTSHDFKRSNFDRYVYFKKNNDGSFVYLLLYVDDMLIAAKDKGEIRKVKAPLSEEFEMKDLGPAKKILGMEILKAIKTSKLYLSQKRYNEKVLCRFNMQSAKPLAAHFRLSSTLSPQSDDEIEYMSHVPYSSAVGSIMYAMVCSRPDLSYAVSAVTPQTRPKRYDQIRRATSKCAKYFILLV